MAKLIAENRHRRGWGKLLCVRIPDADVADDGLVSTHPHAAELTPPWSAAFRLPEGVGCDVYLRQRGLISLRRLSTRMPAATASREPDAGDPRRPVDEGAARRALHRVSLYSTRFGLFGCRNHKAVPNGPLKFLYSPSGETRLLCYLRLHPLPRL